MSKPDAEETRPVSSAMPKLWQSDEQEAIFNGSTRGHQLLRSAEILRSELYGSGDGGPDQDLERTEFTQAINQSIEAELRDLRSEHDPSLRPSLRRESTEQFTAQLADFMRLLSPSLAFAELHRDTATTETVLAVLKASGTERLLHYASYKAEAAWRSLTGVERQRLGNALGEAGLVRSFESPLAIGYSGRVGRLRGYGNAITPQAAAEFIKAFMECG